MKRFTLLTMLFALLSVTAFAQKGMDQRLLKGTVQRPGSMLEMKGAAIHSQLDAKAMKRVAGPAQLMVSTAAKVKSLGQSTISAMKVKEGSRNAQQAAKAAKRIAAAGEAVAPPSTATVETWYTTAGKFYLGSSSGWSDATSSMKTINVAIDGSDIYLKGLAYWFIDGWIKGTIADGQAIFESGQLVGEDEYGPEYIVGSDDGETVSASIIFNYDAEQGILSAVTPYITENSKTDEIAAYGYWVQPTFSLQEPEGPDMTLVTPPATATVETWYTADGTFNVYSNSQYVDATSYMPTVNVAFDGDDIYIQGLAYWFGESWIKGTISGGKAIFANSQFIGEDEYGPEFLVGSDDGESLSDYIVFSYDAEQGILTSDTYFLVESADYDAVSPYCYWLQPTFTRDEPVAPELVVVPDDLVTEEYILSYTDYMGETITYYVNVGFDGNDVYIQGISDYNPEAWIKGTLDGTMITFAGHQYLGSFLGYDLYLQDEDIVFTYDTDADKMTATGPFSVFTANGTEADIYEDAIITKVIEKAATPATPEITEVRESSYGPIVYFDIPIVDVDGNAMVSSKLSYQFFSEMNNEVSAVTFDPADFTELTAAMTTIPYHFTDDYDFYYAYIYFNMAAFSNWNKLGIQSIYTGGGEENKSEIFWFTLKEYAMGDVNHDGEVSIADVMLMVDYNLGQEPEGFFIEQSDLDGDGEVSLVDITGVIAIILSNGQASGE